MLSNPPLNQHFDRSWLSHVSVKATLYEAETQNQAAIGLHAEQEVAPEIARIKVKPTSNLKRMLHYAMHHVLQRERNNLLPSAS